MNFLTFFLASLSALAQSAHDPIPLEAINPPPPSVRPPPKPTPRGEQPPWMKPKLVVIVVADMFRYDYLTRYAADFVKDGFQRLFREGAVFRGYYGYQNTYTAAGHATIISGSYPYIHGIVQNRWYNRSTRRLEAMLYDPKEKLLTGEDSPADETSPRNFIGTTIGDELRLASPASKVVSIALKDRAGILMAGRMGQAYFVSDNTGTWTTSTFYLKELPEWAKKFNDQKLADAAFGSTWDRLLPPEKYKDADDFRVEYDGKGLGKTFPHKLTGGLNAPGPDYYAALFHSPFGIDYTFGFAKAAIEAEQLGMRGFTDLLAISVSTVDTVGHAYGPYSQETQDIVLRLDRAIADFYKYLGQRFKPGEFLFVFTADHGAFPIPEWASERGFDAHRIKKATMKKAVNDALIARFGAGDWVIELEDPSIYLNRDLIAERKLDPEEVEKVAGEAILEIPGFLTYYTRSQLMEGDVLPTRISVAVARSYMPERMGDVITVTEPLSFWGKYAEKDWGTSHGSPFSYDSTVPLIFTGGGICGGKYGDTEMVNLAATLADVLGVNKPAACEGWSVLPTIQCR